MGAQKNSPPNPLNYSKNLFNEKAEIFPHPISISSGFQIGNNIQIFLQRKLAQIHKTSVNLHLAMTPDLLRDC